MTLFKVTHEPLQRTTHTSIFKSTTSPFFHITIFKVPHIPSKFEIIIFKVPHHPLQSIIPPSSRYHTILFIITHHPLQSNTWPFSNYHTTRFEVRFQYLQITTYPLKSSSDLSREINTTSKSLSAVYAAHNNGVNPRHGPHQCALKYKPIRRDLDKACRVRKHWKI